MPKKKSSKNIPLVHDSDSADDLPPGKVAAETNADPGPSLTETQKKKLKQQAKSRKRTEKEMRIAIAQGTVASPSTSQTELYHLDPVMKLAVDKEGYPCQIGPVIRVIPVSVSSHPRVTSAGSNFELKSDDANEAHVSPSHLLLHVQDVVRLGNSDHLWRLDEVRVLVTKGFVPNMRVDGLVFASDSLMELLLQELEKGGGSGFIPALNQIGNVAGLPGILGYSVGMPDIHSGYGFAIGNVAAIDADDPEGVVSPGGVGFDINCGVRLLRTNLIEKDIDKKLAKLADAVYHSIPVGTGSKGGMSLTKEDLDAVMNKGMEYLLTKGLVWPEDCDVCEEHGRIPGADSTAVSDRAKARGIAQIGTMGSGNHYTEIQIVDEVMDTEAAKAYGLFKGQVVIMIHSGSRGFGHQICTDYLQKLDSSTRVSGLNDRQLACAPISSPVGSSYLAAMAAAANFAFCNRSMIAARVRQAFESSFGRDAKESLGMHTVYDVCHNIAKFETHTVAGVSKRVLVHRKGATRAFPANHEAVPPKYRKTGQPVIIGGSMGSCSYVLAGGDLSMSRSFGSTCHGAGREMSRSQAMRSMNSKSVLAQMSAKGIEVRTGAPRLLAEEAAAAYKDVTAVVTTCHQAGISRLVAQLRPAIVVKG